VHPVAGGLFNIVRLSGLLVLSSRHDGSKNSRASPALLPAMNPLSVTVWSGCHMTFCG